MDEEIRRLSPKPNSVEVSLFDVYTTEYFLSAMQTLEEHEEVGDEA